MNMNLKEKKVLIIGLARSGMAAIRLLHEIGVQDITLSDRSEIKDRTYLDEIGVKIVGQEDAVFEGDYDLVIKNPGVPPVSPFIRRLHERGIPVITEIELAYQTAARQHYITITGTNGKTTTTTLVYEILKKVYGDKAHVAGNIGIPLCEVVLDNHMLEEEGHYIALEISQGQLVDIDTFEPEVSVITNLTPDHVDSMGGLENYYLSKTRVYENMKGEEVFLRNLDDDNVMSYTERKPIPCRVLTFSLEKKEADSHMEDGWLIINGEKMLEISRIRLVGQHNLQNIIVAASACACIGIDADVIREVVYGFQGVEHRIEFVRELDGVKYYNDSKGTNTDATITALKAFDHGVILLVGGYEKGLSMDEMKKHLGCVKEVIGYGASGRRIATDLVGDKAHIVTDLVEATHLAKDLAESGDTVLLSPTTSSFDQYSCFEERGLHFKKIVNEL